MSSLLSTYEALLEQYLFTNPDDEQCRHAMDMIDDMVTMTDALKLNRWLGFVQGVLYARGLRTVDQLREETREALAR